MTETCERCQKPIDGMPTMLRGLPERFFHEHCSREHLDEERATNAEADRKAREEHAANEAKWLAERRARDADANARRRLRAFDQAFADCCVGARLADNRELEGWELPGCDPGNQIVARRGPLNFPGWTYARFDNLEFRRRADPRMLQAFEGYDLTAPLVACGETGKAKSASAVARIWKLHDELGVEQPGRSPARLRRSPLRRELEGRLHEPNHREHAQCELENLQREEHDQEKRVVHVASLPQRLNTFGAEQGDAR